MHITASVFINDNESGLHHDYDVWLEKLAPHAPTSQYHHNRTGEDNADAHLKRQIIGREAFVAITRLRNEGSVKFIQTLWLSHPLRVSARRTYPRSGRRSRADP